MVECVTLLQLVIAEELVGKVLNVKFVGVTNIVTSKNFLAICGFTCENGGYCIGPNICECSHTNYTGVRCTARNELKQRCK
jgi:hypothetical protein